MKHFLTTAAACLWALAAFVSCGVHDDTYRMDNFIYAYNPAGSVEVTYYDEVKQGNFVKHTDTLGIGFHRLEGYGYIGSKTGKSKPEEYYYTFRRIEGESAYYVMRRDMRAVNVNGQPLDLSSPVVNGLIATSDHNMEVRALDLAEALTEQTKWCTRIEDNESFRSLGSAFYFADKVDIVMEVGPSIDALQERATEG